MGLSKKEAGKLGYAQARDKLVSFAKAKKDALVVAYSASPKLCQCCRCRLPFEDRRNKFCSSRCSATFNNPIRGPRGKGLCSSCQTPIPKKLKFCSNCWQKGLGSRRATVDTAKDDQTRRKALILERGHQCEVCKLCEWNGRLIPLQLDHIDGNSDNNHRGNLRLICPNCHAQTPTFCSKNKSNRNSSRNLGRRARYHGTTALIAQLGGADAS